MDVQEDSYKQKVRNLLWENHFFGETSVLKHSNRKIFTLCSGVAAISLCMTFLMAWRHLQAIPPISDSLENLSQPYYYIVKDDMFGMDRTFFKLNSSRVTNIPENFSISANQTCNAETPSVLFVVPSDMGADSANTRLEIRQTWASDMYGNLSQQTSTTARLLFFFGSVGLSDADLASLKNESETFGDIVVGNFYDTYDNLSLKMAVIITWVARYCPNLLAMVKVDMDTFVNVDLLLNLLEKLPMEENPKFVFGSLHNAKHPQVLREGKWSVSKTAYPFEFFPKYIYGHSYVLSGSAVKLLAESFPYFPIVPNEDAFITGIMSVVLNITRLYHESFANMLHTDVLDKFDRNILTTALVDSDRRKRLWASLKEKKKKGFSIS